MGRIYDAITPELAEWLARQHVFFVATAPLAADGHVNCSPKGLDALRVLGPTSVGYLDLTGSGIETVAHVRENGRIVLMFCAFEGPPRILRMHGRGEVLEAGTPEFARHLPQFSPRPGMRSIVRVAVERIADSCGFGVPLYEFSGERDTLIKYAEKQGPEAMATYRAEHNRLSIDGLCGLE